MTEYLETLVQYILELPQPAILRTHAIPFLTDRKLITSDSLLSNLHSIIYVALFYQACFLVGKWIIFPPFIQLLKVAPGRKQKLIDQSSVHFVSFIQSVVILYISLNCLLSPNYNTEYPTAIDRIFSENRDTQIVCIFAIGYFTWDIYISVFYSTLPFVLHAVISTLVFCIGLKPYIQYYAPVFLLFELSNPFLNIRWFATKYLGHTSNKLLDFLQLLNNVSLLIVFFFARICWGWFQIAKLGYDFFQTHQDPRFLPYETAIIVLGNLVLNVLNLIWFSTMVSIAIKTLTKKK